jgi:hypothetical protein
MSVTAYSTTSTLQPGPRTRLDRPLLKGVEIEMPKPAGLAVLGLRPHDYFTVIRPDGQPVVTVTPNEPM